MCTVEKMNDRDKIAQVLYEVECLIEVSEDWLKWNRKNRVPVNYVFWWCFIRMMKRIVRK